MQECITCRMEYIFATGDEEYPYLRTLCKCERALSCASGKRCKHPVIQALLSEDASSVIEYRCIEHEVDHISDPRAIDPIPTVEIEKRAPKSALPPLTSQLENEYINLEDFLPKPDLRPDEEVYLELESLLQKEPVDKQTQLRCTYCGNDHTPANRQWIRYKEADRRGLASHCPHCKKSGYVAAI